jgi:hypothetical protein
MLSRSVWFGLLGGLTTLAWMSGAAAARAQPGAPAAGQQAAVLEALRSDPDPRNRREAARLLGRRGDLQAIPPLARSAAFDPERQVRVTAGDAIALIRARLTGSTLQRPPRPSGYAAAVNDWYRLFLNRTPDPVGQTEYVNLLRRGARPEEVQGRILASEEYWLMHGARPASWVAALYEDLLGRSPRPDEVRHWVSRLRGSDRPQIAVQFLDATKNELAKRRAPDIPDF